MTAPPTIPNTRGTVVIGATASDAHVVSLFLATLMMQDEGYDVFNRGCQNTTTELFEALPDDDRPLCYIIVNQNGHAISDLRDMPAARRRAAVDAPIALAGHYVVGASDDEVQRATLADLGVDVFLNQMSDLLPFLDRVRRCEREDSAAPQKPSTSG